MTTAVKVNRRNPNFTLYIGRAWAGMPASKWGNPFRIDKYSYSACGQRLTPLSDCEARQNCLAKYEAYVRSKPELMAALHEIDDQILGCWCYPEACHGDVLIKLRKEQIERIQ